MLTPAFQIRQCSNEACRLRYPASDRDVASETCPRCGTPTTTVATLSATHQSPATTTAGRLHLEVLLDNIRSVYNVGSMFRTADGAGIGHMHLCGITALPNHPRIAKTALGAEQALPWTTYRNGIDAVLALKEQGYQVWALESGPRSESLFEATIAPDSRPALLVVGNELVGVDPGILAHCDRVFALPMQGQKESLNAAVAFGIAIYTLRYNTV
ncbi:MAG TPA: TrmH family RNA methyltransferase [Anaerolineae bacterium]